MKKKIIALLLCACLISSSCIQPAYAVGAEGIIIGGGAAAGVTLTLPQVALIVAAGYGLVFAAQHAEEIADGLNTALTNAANNVADGLEVLSGWKDNALKGLISLSSAPAWIVEAVKGWVSGLYEGAADGSGSSDSTALPAPIIAEYPANTPIPGPMFWTDSTYSFSKDVIAIRSASVSLALSAPSYVVMSALVVLSNEKFSGSSTYTNKALNLTMYYKMIFSSASVPVDNIAGNNRVWYENASAIAAVSDIQELKAMYSPEMESLEEAVILAWADGYFDPANDSVCPDVTVGGIGNAVEEHGIDNINVPDMNIGASGLLAPDAVGDGSIDDVLNDVLTRLKEQDLAWSDYVADVGVGNPSVSIPQEDGTTLDFPITDVGVGDKPIETPSVPEGLEPYTIDLTDFFPFCIPFDIADFVSVLCAEPEAPCFEWEFTWYDGSKDSLIIDLSPFDQVAQLLRNMELLLFCIGLALITRNQIRG